MQHYKHLYGHALHLYVLGYRQYPVTHVQHFYLTTGSHNLHEESVHLQHSSEELGYKEKDELHVIHFELLDILQLEQVELQLIYIHLELFNKRDDVHDVQFLAYPMHYRHDTSHNAQLLLTTQYPPIHNEHWLAPAHCRQLTGHF